jgi:hypothetical protein
MPVVYSSSRAERVSHALCFSIGVPETNAINLRPEHSLSRQCAWEQGMGREMRNSWAFRRGTATTCDFF